MILPDNNPLCADYDPELWFPDPYDFRKSGNKAKESSEKALFALSICGKCPLFDNGKCLEEALKDISTVDYGIWGGTLQVERRVATESPKESTVADGWQLRLRRAATKAGIIKPYIPRQTRPKSNYYTFMEPTSA